MLSIFDRMCQTSPDNLDPARVSRVHTEASQGQPERGHFKLQVWYFVHRVLLGCHLLVLSLFTLSCIYLLQALFS